MEYILKYFKKWLFVAVTISMMVSYLSCARKNSVTVNTLEAVNTLQADDSAAAAALIKDNIVKIENIIDDSTKIVGTGFFDTSGYLVTNSHVVDISGKLNVIYSDGSAVPAKLVANDIYSDIAILAVDKPKCKAMLFSQSSELQETDQLFSAGFAYNLDGWASITKGVLSARRVVDDIEYLQTDAPLSPGCSGGPLFDSKANFLGIITLASENASVGMAISSECLRNIIDRLKSSPMIEYINNDRPVNALSSVLKNIGYRINDIYGEADILTRRKNQKNSRPGNRDESGSNITGNSSISIGSSRNSSNSSKRSTRNAKWSTRNNTENSQSTTTQRIIIESLDGVTKIIGGLNVDRSQTLGKNVFILSWDYSDNDYVRIYPTENHQIIRNIKATVYKGFIGYVPPGTDYREFLKELFQIKISGEEAEKLENNRTIEIPIEQVRQYLKPEDYSGGSYGDVDLTFEIEITTKKQGTFTARLPWGLNKI